MLRTTSTICAAAISILIDSVVRFTPVIPFLTCNYKRDKSSVHTQDTYPYYSRDKGRVSATLVKGCDKVTV